MPSLTLKDIQKTLAELEGSRASPNLTHEESVALEEAVVAVRHLERSLLNSETDLNGKNLKVSAESLAELARSMRSKSKKLSDATKKAESINYLLRQIIEIAQRIL